MSLHHPARRCFSQCTQRSFRLSTSLNPRILPPTSTSSTSRLHQPSIRHRRPSPQTRFASTAPPPPRQDPNPSSSPKGPTPPDTTPPGSSTPSYLSAKLYSFEDIQSLIASPDPKRILIDVREPSELAQTGHIPTSKNIPLTSSPDAFFLPRDEFAERFEFDRPDKDTEVVFYCQAGVRSRAAAKLARQAGFGGRTAEYRGSWVDWAGRGGEVEG